jgi:ATP-dependent Zn protease
MPITNEPKRSRSRWIANTLFIVSTLFLLANLFLPGLFGSNIPQVPYSLFIHQVDEGQVSKVAVGQNQIRYQLKAEDTQPEQVLATTPIFDLELPKRLEDKGVEFAAVPPPKNNWFKLGDSTPDFCSNLAVFCWTWDGWRLTGGTVHWEKQGQGLCRRRIGEDNLR